MLRSRRLRTPSWYRYVTTREGLVWFSSSYWKPCSRFPLVYVWKATMRDTNLIVDRRADWYKRHCLLYSRDIDNYIRWWCTDIFLDVFIIWSYKIQHPSIFKHGTTFCARIIEIIYNNKFLIIPNNNVKGLLLYDILQYFPIQYNYAFNDYVRKSWKMGHMIYGQNS